MDSDYSNPASYRRRAANLRATARNFRDQRLREEMLELADRWDGVAGRLECGEIGAE